VAAAAPEPVHLLVAAAVAAAVALPLPTAISSFQIPPCPYGGQGEGILKLDESCISNPKSRNGRLDRPRPPRSNLRFRGFGFEMQDSSNFKVPRT